MRLILHKNAFRALVSAYIDEKAVLLDLVWPDQPSRILPCVLLG